MTHQYTTIIDSREQWPLWKKGIRQHISRAHKNKHSKLQRTINKMITEGKTE